MEDGINGTELAHFAGPLAWKLFHTHGDAMISEEISFEEVYAINVSLWEEIDDICQRHGFGRTKFRAEVVSTYMALLAEDTSGLEAA